MIDFDDLGMEGVNRPFCPPFAPKIRGLNAVVNIVGAPYL
jgi:hypothetical protein